MTGYSARTYFILVFVLFALLVTSICASIAGAEVLHFIAFFTFVVAVCGFTLHVCLRN